MTPIPEPDATQFESCVRETLRDAVVILIAFLVINFAVQGRWPNKDKLLRFVIVFIPLAASLKYYNEPLAKNLTNGAAFAMATILFQLLSQP
jgi:hypothetical protein